MVPVRRVRAAVIMPPDSDRLRQVIFMIAVLGLTLVNREGPLLRWCVLVVVEVPGECRFG